MAGVRISLVDDGKLISVRFPYEPFLISLCKTVLGYQWDKPNRQWLYPATRTRAYKIAEVFRSARPEFSEGFQQLLKKSREEPPTGNIPQYKTEPWEHQERAFWFAIWKWGGMNGNARGGLILNLGMGAGKGKVTLDLINNIKLNRSIIICPAKVIDVWPYQAELHSFGDLLVYPLPTKLSTAKRAEKVRNILRTGRRIAIVTNYEATRRKPIRELFSNFKWDLLVLDECHRIKDPGGIDSKYMAKLGKEIRLKLGLTGTLLCKNPLDVYAQARFVRPEIFGTSFARFRSEFAVMGGYEGHQVLGFKNESELAGEIREFAIAMTADEIFPNLPKQHHIDHIISLDEETQKVYDEWDKEFVIALNDNVITAANVLVKVSKCQELTGGCIRDPETGKVFRVGSEKKEAVKEILEGLDPEEPVVVFTKFKQDMEAVSEAFEEAGKGFCELSGSKNELSEWQKGTAPGLICQVASGKYGIDLTRARYMIFYSIGYISAGDYDQIIRRTVRPGQKSDRVIIYHIIAKGTRDRHIYRALKQGRDIIESIMEQAR